MIYRPPQIFTATALAFLAIGVSFVPSSITIQRFSPTQGPNSSNTNHHSSPNKQDSILVEELEQFLSKYDYKNSYSQQQHSKKEIELDRAAFRLDGLEVYSVVSALTLATSIQFFELLSQEWHWGMSIAATGGGRFFWQSIASNLVCLVASALGMMTGLHATLVFSLMTVYGRTAVGIGRDKSF